MTVLDFGVVGGNAVADETEGDREAVVDFDLGGLREKTLKFPGGVESCWPGADYGDGWCMVG